MTGRHYVLWLINAVQDWDKGTLIRALRTSSTPDLPITVELGDREATPDRPGTAMHGIDINDHDVAKARPPPYDLTEYTPYGALMHENGHMDAERLSKRSAHTFDEYFVPIPVKCIGDPAALSARVEQFRDARGRGGAFSRAALDRIIDANARYFVPSDDSDQPYFKKYWDEGLTGAPTTSGLGGEVRMHSKAYVGYYQMLIEWNDRAGHERDRHLLLGYSQGGLVGRFLSHLDDRVFDLGLIHGVVTVQTPNYGSPVARDENAPALERMIRSRIARVRRWLWLVRRVKPDLRPLLEYLERHTDSLDIDGVDDAIEATIRSIRSRIASGEVASAENARKTIETLVSMRKWISGLVGERQGEDLAFHDLSPELTWMPGRVLNAINDATCGHPRIPHAAIVGCNPSVKALFGTLGTIAVETLLRIKISDLTREYQGVFDEIDRLDPILKDEHRSLASLYVKPIEKDESIDRTIPPMAHDCVIPSAHQLMHAPLRARNASPAPPKTFLGNKVNDDSNHASGTKLTDEAPTDLERVVEIFRVLPNHDPI